MKIFESLLLFLPAYYANMCPGFARGFKLPGDKPISEKWLGTNKTWRGHIASIIGGILMAFILYLVCHIPGAEKYFGWYQDHWILLGLAMGAGAKLGDDVKSLIKRRLGKPPGDRWFPFDQIDYILGAIALSMPITGWLGALDYAVVILPTILLHGACVRRAFRKGQKSVPH